MKRIILIMICLALATACAWAQEDVETEAVPLPKSLRQGVNVKKNEAERKVKFLVGGYFGFSIGHNTSVEVSPHFGIMPIKYIAIGIGGTYIYNSYKTYYGIRDKYHIFGASAFVEGYLWNYLVLHASYEYLTYTLPIVDPNTNIVTSERVGTHAVLIGPGYKQDITDKINIYSHILFNLNNDQYSLYSIPIFRIGVNVVL